MGAGREHGIAVFSDQPSHCVAEPAQKFLKPVQRLLQLQRQPSVHDVLRRRTVVNSSGMLLGEPGGDHPDQRQDRVPHVACLAPQY